MYNLSALLAIAAVAAAITTTATNVAVVTPCDDTWSSRQNQTFAFLGVSRTNLVQLYSYWGNNKGCVSNNATKSPELDQSVCAMHESIWTYGPGSIDKYVYYNNTRGECLSLIGNSNSQAMALGLRPCCGGNSTSVANASNCSLPQWQSQMWLEPPVRSDPYNRIRSMLADSNAPFGYCLTRKQL